MTEIFKSTSMSSFKDMIWNLKANNIQMQTNIIECYCYSSDIDIESIDENLEFVILIIEHYTWKESNNFKN